MDTEDDEEEINVPEITALQLTELMASDNPPFLVDVREAYEVAQGMIPGGIHIPMNSIPDRLSEIPQDKPVVIYCASGARSRANWLRKPGNRRSKGWLCGDSAGEVPLVRARDFNTSRSVVPSWRRS